MDKIVDNNDTKSWVNTFLMITLVSLIISSVVFVEAAYFPEGYSRFVDLSGDQKGRAMDLLAKDIGQGRLVLKGMDNELLFSTVDQRDSLTPKTAQKDVLIPYLLEEARKKPALLSAYPRVAVKLLQAKGIEVESRGKVPGFHATKYGETYFLETDHVRIPFSKNSPQGIVIRSDGTAQVPLVGTVTEGTIEKAYPGKADKTVRVLPKTPGGSVKIAGEKAPEGLVFEPAWGGKEHSTLSLMVKGKGQFDITSKDMVTFKSGGSLEVNGPAVINSQDQGSIIFSHNYFTKNQKSLSVSGLFGNKDTPCTGVNCVHVVGNKVFVNGLKEGEVTINRPADSKNGFSMHVNTESLGEHALVRFSRQSFSLDGEPTRSILVASREGIHARGDMGKLLESEVSVKKGGRVFTLDHSSRGSVCLNDKCNERFYPFNAWVEDVRAKTPDLRQILGGKSAKEARYLIVTARSFSQEKDDWMAEGANSVYSSLVAQGIPKDRVTLINFGDKDPSKRDILGGIKLKSQQAQREHAPFILVGMFHNSKTRNVLGLADWKESISATEVQNAVLGPGAVYMHTCRSQAYCESIQDPRMNLAWFMSGSGRQKPLGTRVVEEFFRGIDPNKPVANQLVQNHIAGYARAMGREVPWAFIPAQAQRISQKVPVYKIETGKQGE